MAPLSPCEQSELSDLALRKEISLRKVQELFDVCNKRPLSLDETIALAEDVKIWNRARADPYFVEYHRTRGESIDYDFFGVPGPYMIVRMSKANFLFWPGTSIYVVAQYYSFCKIIGGPFWTRNKRLLDLWDKYRIESIPGKELERTWWDDCNL